MVGAKGERVAGDRQKARNHKDLHVWQRAMSLVVSLYGVLKSFPADERFSLVDQIKRSAVSIPSNIAEGAARQTSREFIQFLHIAAGSAAELDTQLIIAQRLGFSTAIESQLEELQIVRKQLNVIIASLRAKHEK